MMTNCARAFTKIDIPRRLRYAVEIRHPSFMVPEFFELLREHNIAFVFADTARKWPYAEDLTAAFVYVRLHGDTKLYVSGYSDNRMVGESDRALARRQTTARRQTDSGREIALRCPRTPQRGVPTTRYLCLLR
jgi:uncharacterized protein YecE (DUF72 family)